MLKMSTNLIVFLLSFSDIETDVLYLEWENVVNGIKRK